MTQRQNNSAEIKASATSRKAVLIFDTLRITGKDGIARAEEGGPDDVGVGVGTAHGLSNPLWSLISCFMGQPQTVAGELRESVAF